ncbi:voltage-gated chloride channel family protein [Chitinophaga lutea]
MKPLSILSYLLKWTAFSIPVSLVTGSLVALFLWSLDEVTKLRWQNPWLLWLLPVAGVLIWLSYRYAGKNAEGGNNLIIDEIHQPGGGVPARMTPLVLLTTLVTHLFGGSAGREGTAVQMGGSMAGLIARWLRLGADDVKVILMTGIAGGFGAVFGTPLAGTVFALEVLAIGSIRYNALLPCLITAVLSDQVCILWGIHHTHYTINFYGHDWLLLLKVIPAGVCFGLAAWAFAAFTHSVKGVSKRLIPLPYLVPVAGGVLIIALTYLLGTTDYLGLGVTSPDPQAVTIVSAFREGGAGYFSWGWKLLFTGITLGMGFKGGEVTPLFFVGATLGNAIAVLVGAPVDLMAGLGFIAVFAGATNTPIACTLMGVELFGGEHVLYFAVACFTAYYFSGHKGIYAAQRMEIGKGVHH